VAVFVPATFEITPINIIVQLFLTEALHCELSKLSGWIDG